MRAKLSRSSTIFIHTRWTPPHFDWKCSQTFKVCRLYLSYSFLGWVWVESRCWTAQVWCQPWRWTLPHVNLLQNESRSKQCQPGGSRYMKPEETWRLPTVKCLSWSSNSGPASLRLECLPAGAKHIFHLFGGVLLSLQSEVQSIGLAERELPETPSLVIEI